MNDVKVLFVGVGSIAKRHIKNLKNVLLEQKCECHIDVFRSSGNRELDESIKGYVDEVFFCLDDVPDSYDIIFITNPTEYHLQTLQDFHMRGKHFFIEKPICTCKQLETIGFDYLQEDKVYYVASPLRYTAVLQYVNHNIDLSQVYAVRSISSSYLPDWRPGIDYRTTYSAHKELGGGVAIDLIHEWDYLTYLFGKPSNVHSILRKVSDLDIDTEDVAIYIGEYENKVVELHLDYLGRQTIRKLELFMKEDTIVCDLVNSTICFLKSGKKIEFGQERNAFQMEEIRYFLNLIKEKKCGKEKLEEAVEVLRLTGGN